MKIFPKKGHSKIWSAKFFPSPNLGAKSPPMLIIQSVYVHFLKLFLELIEPIAPLFAMAVEERYINTLIQ